MNLSTEQLFRNWEQLKEVEQQAYVDSKGSNVLQLFLNRERLQEEGI